MHQKENETTPGPLKSEELTELQKLLQTDNIAPVDRITFGMRLAETSYVFATSASIGSPSEQASQILGRLLLPRQIERTT